MLSSSQGHLFGGYTDVSWTTPKDNIPHYNSSDRSFLFTLQSPSNGFIMKFSLNNQYKKYAIVNDQSSGPIFGGMSQPDIGIYESNQQFRCQIHFPIVYKSAVGVSLFPNSENCIVREIEVFGPIFASKIVTLTPTTSISYIFGWSALLTYMIASNSYNRNQEKEGRSLIAFCLLLTGIHFWIEWMPTFAYLFTFILLFDLYHIQGRERSIHPVNRGEKTFIVFLFLTILFLSGKN